MTTPEEASSIGPLVHGQLCYLQIPANDVWQSAQFYATVFGWSIEHPYPSFVAPGLIGQWVDDRPPAPDAGPLAWLNVDHIDTTLDLIAQSGGSVLEGPRLDDGVRWLATARDPAGNTIGVVQLGPR
jgi:predicted enzyme related to lactoylglutathione lyase